MEGIQKMNATLTQMEKIGSALCYLLWASLFLGIILNVFGLLAMFPLGLLCIKSLIPIAFIVSIVDVVFVGISILGFASMFLLGFIILLISGDGS